MATACTATCGSRSSPSEPGAGYVFENKIVGGVIPKEFIPSIEKGVREAMRRGVLAGYPVIDVKVSLFDGSYHDVDSSGPAFEVAASMGFQDGVKTRRIAPARAGDGGRGRRAQKTTWAT